MRPWSAWRRSCGSRPRSVLGGEKPTRRTGLVGPQFRADADEADASVERNRSLRPGHFAQRCAAFSSPFVTAGVTASVNSAKNILARNAALAGTFSAPRETRTPTRGTPGQGPQPCGDGSARHDIYRSESLSRGWLDEGERESAQVNLGQLRISLCAKRSGRRAAPKRRAKSAPSPWKQRSCRRGASAASRGSRSAGRASHPPGTAVARLGRGVGNEMGMKLLISCGPSGVRVLVRAWG